ncbi:hypothetical protein BH18ACT4_BH18ACT4_11840 [soil metagenome]
MRVRVTDTATVVTAVAVALAAFGLVRAVEHSLLDRLRDDAEQRLEAVADQIQAGVPPPLVTAALPPGGAFVQLFDSDHDVFFDSPAVEGASPLLVPVGDLSERAGTVTLEAPLPGHGQEASLDVVYRSVETTAGDVTVVAASPLADVERSVAALRRALVVGLPLLVGVVGLIAWFATGRALRPVETMRSEVEAITASTIHRRVAEPPTCDEVSRLARTMNDMLDRLEQAAVRQRQFVSDASHELRSPVTTIRTELEVARNQGPDADWDQVADSVLAEEGRLEALVTDLLLLASVDEQRAGRESTVDLGRLVIEEAGRSRRLPVDVDVAGGLTVNGRADHLRRVVANLVDNAVHHGRATVRVTATRRDGRARIVVDDDGPGIPEPDRARVFERFARLEQSRSRDAGGAGLGLALVRSIVEHHGGSVRVEDAPIGGARLVVELATAAPGTATKAAPPR